MAIDVIEGIFNLWSQEENSSYQKYMTRLKQQQLELDKGQSYNSALDTLIQMGGTYEELGLQITAGQSSLAESREWLSRYGDYYDYVMGQAQLNVDQTRSNAESLIYSGLNNYVQQNANWQNQLTRAAEIGQSGGTAKLLAAAQKQSLVNTFGADLTVDSEGGTFGRQMQMQNDAVSIARQGMEQQRLDLEAERQTVINNMGITEQAIASMQKAQGIYLASFQDALASTIKQGHYNGETYSDLSEMVDRYRGYLGNLSDEQYTEIKNNLLSEWKPIDFEIRTMTHDWETGGESQHGANYHSVDYYQIYDKATGQLATQEQVENILRNYAGNMNEKDWYSKSRYAGGTMISNSYGLSNKAIETIMKNSNYKQRKDYK